MSITDIDRNIISKLHEVRQQSHDPDRQVGVIIANSSGEVLCTGANQPPLAYRYSPVDTHNAIRSDTSWKYYMLEHAERNAILTALQGGIDLRGSTLYGTLFPCADCARAIVAAGIARVVVPVSGLNPTRDQKWQEHYKYAKMVFDVAGVNVENFDNGEQK